MANCYSTLCTCTWGKSLSASFMWRWSSYSHVNVWLHARVGVCPTDLRVTYSYLLAYMWSCTYTPVTLLPSLHSLPSLSLPSPPSHFPRSFLTLNDCILQSSLWFSQAAKTSSTWEQQWFLLRVSQIAQRPDRDCAHQTSAKLAEHNKHSEKQQCWWGWGDGRESGEPKEPRVTLTQAASI